MPFCRIVEARNQIDHRGFAGTCTAYDADGLPFVHNKINVCQGFIPAAAVGKAYMMKDNHCVIFFVLVQNLYNLFIKCTALHARRDAKNALDTLCTGKRLGELYDQVCHLDQFYQNL